MIPRNGPPVPRPERLIPVDLNLNRARFAYGHVAIMGLVRSLWQAIAKETAGSTLMHLERRVRAHGPLAEGAGRMQREQDEERRVAQPDTCADRDRERYLAARSALTGQTVAPGCAPPTLNIVS